MPDGAIAPKRRERRKLEMRERIIDAAISILTEQTFEETKVLEICDRADIAYGTFFQHFPAKQDLLIALSDRYLGSLSEWLQTLAAGPGDASDHIQLWFVYAAEILDSLGEPTRALMASAASTTSTASHGARLLYSASEAYIRRGLEAEKVRDDTPPSVLAEILAGTMLQMVFSYVHFSEYPVLDRASAAGTTLGAMIAK